jgi:hypothetical protein
MAPYIVGVDPIGDDVELDTGVMEGESKLSAFMLSPLAQH